MRATKLVRKLIGIASFFVTGLYFEDYCLIVKVRPSWRKPRCSGCGKIRPGYDRRSDAARWIHLSIGSIRIILEYAPRRTECPTCGVLVEQLPWARADCRFTRPFEELTAYLAQITNKTEVTKIMGISWRTVGNIIKRVVNDKLDTTRLDGLRSIGIDEFSYRKRHRYITIVVDHVSQRVVWSAEGKGSDTLNKFFDELGEERTEKIETITADMSAAYTKSIKLKAPKAKIIYDLFHVLKLASTAIDEVRRAMVNEYKDNDQSEEAKAIKKSRYVLLKSQWNLSAKQWDKLCAIYNYNAKLYRAYLLKESLRGVFDETNIDDATKELDRWLSWASRSKLKPFVRIAKTIRKHKEGILAYVSTEGLTNGIAEGFNNKLRMIARRAFGFHSAEALISMLFLCCGGVTCEPALPGGWT